MARRSPAYLLAALCLTALSLLVTAAPAWAHATLVSSSPADSAIVRQAPARVSATFDEPVVVSADSLRVFAPSGARVDTGGTARGSKPAEINVALAPGLTRGTYTVAWHVVAADDGHRTQGEFTFSIGAPSSTVVTPASLRPPSGWLVGFTFGAVRWLAFSSFALLSGLVTFLIWCWPAGAARPAVLRLAMVAWGGLAASVLAAVMLQGVYGAGQGINRVFWPDVLHATVYSRYGRALGARLLLVIATLFAFTVTLGTLPDKDRRARAISGMIWGVLTAALAATWGVADHAGTGSQVALAVPADTVHLSAMATWLGGLATLVAIVLRRPRSAAPPGPRGAAKRGDQRRDQMATAEAAEAVIRFSPIALGCVVAMVISGTYMAWRNVGTLGALTGTTYGRLLLVKIAGMCCLIGLGYLARRRIADGLQAPAAAALPAVPATAVSFAPARGKAGAAAARVPAGAAVRAGRAKGGTSTPAASPSSFTARGGRGRPARGANGGEAAAEGGREVSRGAPRAGAPAGPDHGAPSPADRTGVTLRRLRGSVAAESVIALVVLAVTAVLVNTPTARESYFPPANAAVSFNAGSPGGRGTVSLTVTPARLGPNQFRVSVTTSGGQPYRPGQLDAALVLPARHLGPLPVRLTPAGPGRYLAGPAVLSTAGRWQLQITIRSDASGQASVAIPFSVR